MGNATSTDSEYDYFACKSRYNITIASSSVNLFSNDTDIILSDDPSLPVNTFSFFNAFVLFCIQGLIFKPISALLKRRYPGYKSTFYPGGKLFKNVAVARMQDETLRAASTPFLDISNSPTSVAAQKPLPWWASFLQNNVMCFCDPLFAFYHTLFHVAHFVYILVRARHRVHHVFV